MQVGKIDQKYIRKLKVNIRDIFFHYRFELRSIADCVVTVNVPDQFSGLSRIVPSV